MRLQVILTTVSKLTIQKPVIKCSFAPTFHNKYQTFFKLVVWDTGKKYNQLSHLAEVQYLQ